VRSLLFVSRWLISAYALELRVAACPHAFWKIWQNRWTSAKVLYKGAGATRTTSGCRSSTTTPCSSRYSRTGSRNPGFKRTLNCAPLSSGFLGLMIVKSLLWESFDICTSKSSRYAVSCRDFFLRAGIEASLKIWNDAVTAARSRALGLDS
jgi:hypothetical protein